ncbi:MAG: nucleotidyltransferase domain-containing protein [Methanosarcinales archaeon]
MEIIKKLREDFSQFKKDAFAILLFGSQVKGNSTERSDIDVCIVKPNSKDLLAKVYKKVGGKYDVKIFEELPLHIKIDIINNHNIIYGNNLDLSEYFYYFRKLWSFMVPRIKANQFRNFKERMDLRIRWLNEKEKILEEIRMVGKRVRIYKNS